MTDKKIDPKRADRHHADPKGIVFTKKVKKEDNKKKDAKE